jgi:DNA polymerase-3 subunit gamma/tau
MKEALALKYRPHDWDSLSEQSQNVAILKQQVDTGTVRQAYMFCGKSGAGKTTSARILANSIDAAVIELDAASHSGVDDVRELVEDSKHKPIGHKYKVYIIDEAHLLSSAANAVMLKATEEPPDHVIYIMCTTDPQKMLETLLSRLQRFNFNRISDAGIVARLRYIIEQENLEGEHLTATDGALQIITQDAGGSMRKAISWLDKHVALSPNLTEDSVYELIKGGGYSYSTFKEFLTGDTEARLRIISTIENHSQFIDDLLEYTIVQVKSQLGILAQSPQVLTTKELISAVSELRKAAKYDSNVALLLEAATINVSWNTLCKEA